MTASDPEATATVADARRPWTRLLAVLAAGMAVWAAVLNVLAGLVPPVLVFGVLFVAGIFVVRRWPVKAGPIFLMVITVGTAAGGAPFAIEAAPHPESPADFLLSTVVPYAVGIGILVAGVGALREWRAGPRRAVAWVVPGVVAGLAVLSIGAASSLEDDAVATGDLTLVTEDAEFAPDALVAGAGTVAVFVDNADPIRHTFTIEELGVDLEVPASTARRVEFQAQPGTYEYFCSITGHEAMRGEIVVTG